MKRILAWIVLILFGAFVIWSIVTIVQCSAEDKVRYRSYFDVDKVEDTDDHITFSIKNDVRATKKMTTKLLVYGLVFKVKTTERKVFEYTVTFAEIGAENVGEKMNTNVLTLSPKNSFEHTVSYADVKAYMEQAEISGEIKWVKVKDVLFSAVEIISHDYDGEHQTFVYFDLTQSLDYYFNIYLTETPTEYGIQKSYSITVNNLVEGALYYDIKSIVLKVTNTDGNSTSETLYGKVLTPDDSYNFEVTLGEDIVSIEIVDISFSIGWE